MKIISLPVFLILMLSLGGCSLFGWSENGIRSSTPIVDRDEWIKENINEAQRQEDWLSCGGNSAGHVKISPLTHTGIPTYQEAIQADREYDAVQACMMKKGYKFIGSCRGPLGGRLACKGRSIFNL